MPWRHLIFIQFPSYNEWPLTFQSDGDNDDDGNITVSVERLSFDLEYDDDDDVRRH